jgi:hypothetical protein
MNCSYDVRIWKTEQYSGPRGTTHKVRWAVAGQRRKKSFRTKALADSFRSSSSRRSARGRHSRSRPGCQYR